MIEQEKLMIGDYVLDGKDIVQVTAITCNGNIETTKSRITNVEQLEPILLTETILKNSSFYWGYTPSEEYSISNMPEDIPLIMPGKHWCYDNENDGEVTVELPNESDGGSICICNNGKWIEYLFEESISLHEFQHLLTACGLQVNFEL